MRWMWLILTLLCSSFAYSSDISIQLANDPPEVFSLKQLSTDLPKVSFSTQLPWLQGEHQFTGFRVSDLLSYLQQDQVSSVTFIALNDYAANISIADIEQYEPIVAYYLDGTEMKIRNKGPFWLVYNLDKNPKLNNPIYYTHMVWQISHILIHKKP
ncbi:oxidoreductase [Vibrio metoecus]|uniref:Oxidoreductase n=2 Tax=Vibrio metoecus TaxID=1481663 RepID=A0A0N8VBC6_VIBMT|nr:oxidoreductase [Vibrio metoecus]KQA23373.1 oxidoreductase [Vibrio metoecus]KQA27181.1 oxidoreductase [Vibrio metoecus]KQA99048.1 oxidoreductase [Vibrio metoecus]KQB03619.1 oxidoreductase [Vibrio metoecus]KQB06101.1 oxidoreductase [Vibrio metoecus]